jgi:hypothetical protein
MVEEWKVVVEKETVERRASWGPVAAREAGTAAAAARGAEVVVA